MNDKEQNAIYTCKAEFGISDFDREMIADCYLPLIGSTCITLYEILLRQANRDSISIKSELISLLGITRENLNNSLHKLEAVGLISTYKLEERSKINYIYKIYVPLTPSDYFKNPLLVSLLSTKVSKRRIMEIRMKYTASAKIPDDYVDMSYKFSDVFDTEPDYDELMMYSGKTLNLKAKEFQQAKTEIDIEKYQKMLRDKGVDFSSVKNDVSDIYKLCSLYGFKENDAAELTQQAVDSYGIFNFDVFKNYASNYFKFKIDDNTPSEDDNKVSFGTSAHAMRLRKMQDLDPQSYLHFLLKSKSIPKSYDKLLYTMAMEYNAPNSIINVVVDYTLQACNGKLPDQYVIKTYLSLKHSNITSAADAMAFLYQDRSNMYSKNKKKDEILPEEKPTDAAKDAADLEYLNNIDFSDILGD